jgi:hypothetical protein
MIDPTRTLADLLAPIKGGLPRLQSSHQLTLLSSLILLEPLLLHIIAGSHPIAHRSSVAPPQKLPSISATSSAPTTTAALAVDSSFVYNPPRSSPELR